MPLGKRQNSNGPIQKITSTLDKDYKSVQRSYGDWKSGAYSAGTAFDRGLKRFGRGSYKRGLMKGGGYLGGAMIGLDWLFD